MYTSCLVLEWREFRYFKVKIEESEKAGKHSESKSGHQLVLCHSVCVTYYILPQYIEWLLGVRLRHFCTTCAVHVEDCGGWWLSCQWQRLNVTTNEYKHMFYWALITAMDKMEAGSIQFCTSMPLHYLWHVVSFSYFRPKSGFCLLLKIMCMYKYVESKGH